MTATWHLTGELTTWQNAVAGPLAGATCLWQDLDGLHVAVAPPTRPHTSILWGWTDDGALLRARLDGDTTYLARWTGPADAVTLPWQPTDLRVAAYRGPGATDGGLGSAYVELVVHPDGSGTGPISFVRPQHLGRRDG